MSTHGSERRCDCCGRLIRKATRIYKGEDYCASCYQREFPRIDCSECGIPSRIHRSDKQQVCLSCIRAGRRCARCQRPTPVASLIQGDCAFCASCANVINDKGSRPTPGYSTCSSCRRHRKIVASTRLGKPLCKKCMDPVTASIEKDKVKDYWFARHYEETYVLAASLPNQALGDLFIAFSFEQAERRGHTHAALQLKNHNQSLLEIDGIVGGLSHASAKDFSSRIDALTLKSYALWWEFLGRNGYPVPSRSEARSLSDARRIEAILEELSFSADKSLIREFLDNVRRAERPPSISTQRLYTRAAKKGGVASLRKIQIAYRGSHRTRGPKTVLRKKQNTVGCYGTITVLVGVFRDRFFHPPGPRGRRRWRGRFWRGVHPTPPWRRG